MNWRWDGTVAAWGYNAAGQLGDGSTTERHVPVAVNTGLGSALHGKTVVLVAVGSFHSLALCSDGTLAAWGANFYGQLGDNQAENYSLVPVAVNMASGSALDGKTVVAIAAGDGHSLALCSDGALTSWGRNAWGQLGDNTTVDKTVPVAVNTNSGVSALYGKKVVALAAGYNHSLALCSDGTVAAWGYNDYGQVGDNTSGTNRLAPVAVNTNAGVSALYGKTVVSMAAGTYHSLALCSDGTAVAWGSDGFGKLGDNATTQRNAPVAVNTNSGVSALYGKTVVAIAAGDYHSLALCSDGTLTAWGGDFNGQLGDNSQTLTNRLAPVAVNTSQLAPSQLFVHASTGPNARHTLALVAAPPASDINLIGTQTLTNSSFQFSFTNTPGGFFGVLAATNPVLPLSNWTSLTGLTELSPGQFQFTDSQATNIPRRFYRVRSP